MANVRQKMHDGVDKMMDQAESISESTNDEIEYLKDKAIMMKGNVDGYIKKNPEKSVLIAAGVGAVVGAILTAALVRRRQ